MRERPTPSRDPIRGLSRRAVLGAVGLVSTSGCLEFTDPASPGDGEEGSSQSNSTQDTGRSGADASSSQYSELSFTDHWSKSISIESVQTDPETVIVVGQNGTGVRGFELDSGTRLWKTQTESEFFRGVPTIHDSHVIVGAQNGDLLEIDISTGSVLRSVHLQDGVTGAPLVTPERIIVTTANLPDDILRVFGIDIETFELDWMQEFSGQSVYRGGVVHRDTFHGSFSNSLRGFSVEDGTLQYKNADHTGPPVLGDEYLYYVQRGSLKKTNPLTFSAEWTFGSDLDFQLILGDSHVYAFKEQTALAIDRATGEETWEAKLPRPRVGGAPARSSELLWVPVRDGLTVISRETGRVVMDRDTEFNGGIEVMSNTLVQWSSDGLQVRSFR